MIGIEQIQRETGAAHDADQQIIEIVGDSAGQHADAVQFLTLAQGFFRALLVFEIGEGSKPSHVSLAGG